MNKNKSTPNSTTNQNVFIGVLLALLLIAGAAAGCLVIELAAETRRADKADERLEDMRADAVYIGVGEWSINARGVTEFQFKRQR